VEDISPSLKSNNKRLRKNNLPDLTQRPMPNAQCSWANKPNSEVYKLRCGEWLSSYKNRYTLDRKIIRLFFRIGMIFFYIYDRIMIE